MNTLYQNNTIYKIETNGFSLVLNKGIRALKCLFVVKTEDELPPEVIEMFEKIIAALQLDTHLADITTFKQGIPLTQVINQHQAACVIVFGGEASELHIQADLQLYKPYQFGAYQLLLVNDVLDIYGNQQLKSKLWALLKPMLS